VEKFAGKNLANLLDKSPDTAVKEAESVDIIVETAGRGKPLPVPVIDAHCHVLHQGLQGIGASYLMPEGDLKGILKINRHIGIDMAAVMSWVGPVGQLITHANQVVADAVKSAPEEIVGLSTCNPVQQTEEEIVELCRHLHLELGFRGCKPYHFSDMSYNDRGYNAYWEFADRQSLYGLLHIATNKAGINCVEDLASRYPNATFLIAHSCSDWKFAKLVAESILKYPNIMAEITFTSVPNGIIEWLCRTAGSDRVIFGTDASMRDPRPQLGWCIYTRLDIEDKKKILAGNFAKVIAKGKLPGHRLPQIVSMAAGS
jgi:predicted TIM-barrel fold metal-dependent hydrolase